MRALHYSVFVVGASSILTQLALLREFLAVYYGNELVFGVILGNWLLLAGAGSYLGRRTSALKDKTGFYAITLLYTAVALPAVVYAARASRQLIAVRGEMASLPEIALISLFVLAPYCIVSGLQVILAAGILTEKEKNKARGIGRVYNIDVIGDLTGGLLFSFILVSILNSFQVVYIAAAANLSAALLLALSAKRVKLAISAALISLLLLFSLSSFNLQEITDKIQYSGQKIVFSENSRYGSVVVTKSGGQHNFYENGVPFFSTENTVAAEETVHYAMIQHPRPEKILLISGGVSGTLDEILKYNPTLVDYVELDPMIIQVAEKYIRPESLKDPRVRTHNTDGRLFVKNAETKYDVVVVDLPDPQTAQLNRFYTTEFLGEVRRILNEGGVCSTSLSSSENYRNPQTRELNSVVYATLASGFKNVIVVPGDENIYVASDRPLSYDIAEKISERGIRTKYVNEYYLPGKLTPERISALLDDVKDGGSVNTDFKPIAYLLQQRYWLSQFNIKLGWLLPLLAIALAVVSIRYKPIPFAVFTVGFAAMALELVILISFQILYGFVYHKVGLIVTSFMIGIAVGSREMTRRLDSASEKTLKSIVYCVAAYSLLVVAANKYSLQALYPLLTSGVGLLVGLLFPLASKLHLKGENTADAMGALYSADLLGAFFGATLASIFLIPLIGVVNVCIMVAVFSAAAALRLPGR